MRVRIPSPLRSYTGNLGEVEASGGSVRELVACLDERFPGIRFRMIDEQDGIREHIRFFVNSEQARDLDAPVGEADVLHIICALSGG